MNPIHHLFGHLVSCKDVTHLVSQMQERDLSAFDRVRLRWHLGVCKACMAFEQQMRFMREAMRRYRE
jgi:hypothetical protein